MRRAMPDKTQPSFPSFAGWTRELIRRGVILYPPGGAAAGCVTVQEGLRPPFDEAEIPATEIACSREDLTTLEGEDAVILSAAGRIVGIILGDDSCTVVE